ncbi:MAG: hypothetical protein MJ066_06170, partial [Clostridia bacterium]|nr:hypothetical protein [Clostridia bacterium]
NSDKVWNKLPEDIRKKIDNGTLTSKDVRDWFSTADKIDEEAFKLLNDSYFKNSHISTFEELNNHISMTAQYFAIYTVLVKMQQKGLLEKYPDSKDLLDLVKVLSSTKEGRRMYSEEINNYDTYDGEALNISNVYLRTTYMWIYDGTLKSAAKVSRFARIVAILNWVVPRDLTTGTTSIDAPAKTDSKTDHKAESLGKTVADYLTDDRDVFMEVFDEITDEQRMDIIRDYYARPKIIKHVKELVLSGKLDERSAIRQIERMLSKSMKDLKTMSDEDFDKVYMKALNKAPEEVKAQLFSTALLSEVSQRDFTQSPTPIQEGVQSIVIPGREYKNRITQIENKINDMLKSSKVARNRLVKEYPTIFEHTDNGKRVKVKEELYRKSIKDKHTVAKYEYLPNVELEELNKQLNKIRGEVKMKLYHDAKALKDYKRTQQLAQQKATKETNKIVQAINDAKKAKGK